MEIKEPSYIKPPYKIVVRFLMECFNYLKKGENIWPVILDFPIYYKYNRKIKRAFDAELPWISHRALKRLEEIIHSEMNVLEYGSGGSTLFLADRVKQLISIEHDKSWAEIVSIKIKNHSNKKLYYIPADESCVEDEFRSNYGMSYSGKCFKTYSLKVLELADDSLDLLIIDGRARPACLKYAHKKVSPGGYILFDNSDRVEYQASITTYLRNWRREDYKGVTVYDAFFNSTSIFQKPL